MSQVNLPRPFTSSATHVGASALRSPQGAPGRWEAPSPPGPADGAAAQTRPTKPVGPAGAPPPLGWGCGGVPQTPRRPYSDTRRLLLLSGRRCPWLPAGASRAGGGCCCNFRFSRAPTSSSRPPGRLQVGAGRDGAEQPRPRRENAGPAERRTTFQHNKRGLWVNYIDISIYIVTTAPLPSC